MPHACRCNDVRHKWIGNEKEISFFFSFKQLKYSQHGGLVELKKIIQNTDILLSHGGAVELQSSHRRLPPHNQRSPYLAQLSDPNYFISTLPSSKIPSVSKRIHPGSICAESFVNRSKEEGMYLRLDA